VHCKPTTRSRAAARAWLVLIVVWANAPASSAADECELPNAAGGWVLPTSRFEEFRITLNPPDYGNPDAEFTTLMGFDSIDSVRNFMGTDYRVSHVPAEARAVLARFDAHAEHHDVVDRRPQQRGIRQ
jgi:hypothetical protein